MTIFTLDGLLEAKNWLTDSHPLTFAFCFMLLYIYQGSVSVAHAC